MKIYEIVNPIKCIEFIRSLSNVVNGLYVERRKIVLQITKKLS